MHEFPIFLTISIFPKVTCISRGSADARLLRSRIPCWVSSITIPLDPAFVMIKMWRTAVVARLPQPMDWSCLPRRTCLASLGSNSPPTILLSCHPTPRSLGRRIISNRCLFSLTAHTPYRTTHTIILEMPPKKSGTATIALKKLRGRPPRKQVQSHPQTQTQEQAKTTEVTALVTQQQSQVLTQSLLLASVLHLLTHQLHSHR